MAKFESLLGLLVFLIFIVVPMLKRSGRGLPERPGVPVEEVWGELKVPGRADVLPAPRGEPTLPEIPARPAVRARPARQPARSTVSVPEGNRGGTATAMGEKVKHPSGPWRRAVVLAEILAPPAGVRRRPGRKPLP